MCLKCLLFYGSKNFKSLVLCIGFRIKMTKPPNLLVSTFLYEGLKYFR